MKASTRLAASVALIVAQGSAQATTINLVPDGTWHPLDVDSLISQSGGLEWIDAQNASGYSNDGSPLSFSFTLTHTTELRVVDAGFAGDVFQVSINGSNSLTSAAVNSYPTSVGLNYDAAWGNPNYSKASYILGPGTYTLTGQLSASALANGLPIDATAGGVQLVPEPGTWGMLVAGLIAVAGIARRRLI